MKRPTDEWRGVLIVDDDRDTRDMYSESLRAEGFDVLTASSGEEALRLVAHAAPAVIVTDLRLGGEIDGLALARRLRADSLKQRTRIIMLTGATFGDERAGAKAAGCDRFLLKPCLPEALANEIRGISQATPRARKSSPAAGRPQKAAPGYRLKA